MATMEQLEAALAFFTKKRYVIRNGRVDRFIDTDVLYDGDTVVFDRIEYEHRDLTAEPVHTFEIEDVSDEVIANMARNLDYVRYVQACEAENLDAHSLAMWEVHGQPTGPLG